MTSKLAIAIREAAAKEAQADALAHIERDLSVINQKLDALINQLRPAPQRPTAKDQATPQK